VPADENATERCRKIPSGRTRRIRECWAAWDAGDPAAVASFVAAEFSTTYIDRTGGQGRVAPADVHDGDRRHRTRPGRGVRIEADEIVPLALNELACPSTRYRTGDDRASGPRSLGRSRTFGVTLEAAEWRT
jgi:hypothetical protein